MKSLSKKQYLIVSNKKRKTFFFQSVLDGGTLIGTIHIAFLKKENFREDFDLGRYNKV
jgi:hypothetical protein